MEEFAKSLSFILSFNFQKSKLGKKVLLPIQVIIINFLITIISIKETKKLLRLLPRSTTYLLSPLNTAGIIIV